MPTLRETLNQLLELQQADRERERLAKVLRDLDNGQSAQAEAEDAYQAAQAATAALHKSQADLKDAELELATVEKKIKVFEQKMQGGQTISTREMVNIEKEIAQLIRQRSGLDEKILTLMDQIERQQIDAAHADAFATERQERRNAILNELRERRRVIECDHENVSDRRMAALAVVEDKALLAKYDSLRAKPANSGIAIAKATDGACGACHMQAASQDILRAQEGEELTICPNCGRIMA